MAVGKCEFKVGDRVIHKKLGEGDILDVYPSGDDTVVVISFEKWGQKKIILRYAQLELVPKQDEQSEGGEEES